MLLSISISMKFLDLLRFIDSYQWHVNLGYAYLPFMTGMPRIMNKICELNHAKSAWYPARVRSRIASLTSPLIYVLRLMCR